MIRLFTVGLACALVAGCHSSSSYRCTYAARPVVAAPACPTPCPNGAAVAVPSAVAVPPGVAVPPPPAYPRF